MKSMTGYGHAEYNTADYTIEIDIKSYNNRYLDISHNISYMLASFEAYCDEMIKKAATRGHVDFSLRLKTKRNTSELNVDEALLASYIEAFGRIASLTGKEPSFSDYATLENLITINGTPDPEQYREAVEAALAQALQAFTLSKKRDGEGTLKDLQRLGSVFEDCLKGIEERKELLEASFRKILLEKYQELTGRSELDSPVFVAELAALLVKYSINEECSRLKVHLKEYRRLLSLDEPVGKMLDFLCQEMNRECNTIASKSQQVEINLFVVKMKDALEDIREQIRNIE